MKPMKLKSTVTITMEATVTEVKAGQGKVFTVLVWDAEREIGRKAAFRRKHYWTAQGSACLQVKKLYRVQQGWHAEAFMTKRAAVRRAKELIKVSQ